MHSHDFFNRRGVELCHAVGCRKHKKLLKIFQGKFCYNHARLLQIIRDALNKAKLARNLSLELHHRQEEMLFRKRIDGGHVTAILNLSKAIDK